MSTQVASYYDIVSQLPESASVTFHGAKVLTEVLERMRTEGEQI
jgi:hypothetical protein